MNPLYPGQNRLMRSHPGQSKGFTLVEVLVSAGIIIFALSSLLALCANVISLNESSQNQFVAMNHMGYAMEEIKNTTFSSISSAISAGSWDWNSNTIISRGLTPLFNESIDTSVSGTDILTVTMTATWQDSRMRSRSLTFRTQIVEP